MATREDLGIAGFAPGGDVRQLFRASADRWPYNNGNGLICDYLELPILRLQACALRRVLVAPTGRCWTEEGMKAHEWRHTTFWSLDTDWIKRIAEANA